jgi:single-strand DNA-binding protein
MLTLNKVTLIGNVGRDPDIRTTQDGKEVASFTLATADVWRDKNTNEKKEKTEWHRIIVFPQNSVNFIKNNVRKGARLYVEGSLQTRKWQDQTNSDKYVTEILLQSYDSKLLLLSSPHNKDDPSYGSNTSSSSSNTPSSSTKNSGDDFDDDIPF